MDIIKPNSSYPSIHDGLHILTGSYVSQTSGGSDRITSTLIKTGMRTITYAHIYSMKKYSDREGTIPAFASQYRLLGYLEETDAQNFTKNLNIVVPNGEIMNYLIIGTDQIPNLPTQEIIGSTGTVETDKKILKLKIPSAGTGATKLESNVKQTVTCSYLDGVYTIQSNVAFFSENKTFVTLSLDSQIETPDSYSVSSQWVDSTHYVIYVFKNDDDPEPALAPGNIYVSFEVYP